MRFREEKHALLKKHTYSICCVQLIKPKFLLKKDGRMENRDFRSFFK